MAHDEARPSLQTYEPIGTLKPVADAIWIADGPIIRFGYPGLRFPFTTRMALVRLRDRTLSRQPCAARSRRSARYGI